jgi:hypothetical protein
MEAGEEVVISEMERRLWRWFTGQPRDGVPRTDATWFRRGTRELDRGEAPKPPATLREEIHASAAEAREEWRDLIAEPVRTGS